MKTDLISETNSKIKLEKDRLNFVYKRDGIEETLNFAYATLKSYRKTALSRKLPDKKRQLIMRYLEFKYFIKHYLEFIRES